MLMNALRIYVKKTVLEKFYGKRKTIDFFDSILYFP